MKSLKQLLAEQEELLAKLAEISKQMKPLEKKLTTVSNKLDDVQEQIGKVKNEVGWKDEEFFVYDPRNDSMALLHAKEKFANTFALSASGYLPDTIDDKGTCQFGFTTRFYKNEKHPDNKILDEQVALAFDFFTKYKKYMRPLKKTGMFFLDVFEASLSEFGTWHIEVALDLKTAKLFKTTYGFRALKLEKSFKEVLQYVAENLYYK